jgi:hypothetical protein
MAVYLSVLVQFWSAVVCCDTGCWKVTLLRGKKVTRMILGEVYVPKSRHVGDSGPMWQPARRTTYTKWGMCTYARYPWWSTRDFRQGKRLHAERFPMRRASSRHFKHQLWTSTSVFLLFHYRINYTSFTRLSLCVTLVFLKRQRPLPQNGDVTLVQSSRTALRCCTTNDL